MKKIKLGELITLTGKPFIIPKFDDEEKPVTRQVEVTDNAGNAIKTPDGQPVTREELDLNYTKSLLDVLEHFVLRGLPAKTYTKKDAIHVGNIYRSIAEARKTKADILELGEDDHDWLKGKLNDDSIGVKMFTRNQPIIIEAVENIVKPHEPKSKE